MARFDRGWFQVDRADVFSFERDGYTLAIFTLLNCWANLETRHRKCGQTEVTIAKGSILTSTAEISEFTGFAKNTVKRSLKYLAKNGALVSQRVHRGMLISLQKRIESSTHVTPRDVDSSKSSPENEIDRDPQEVRTVTPSVPHIEEVISNNKKEGEGTRAHAHKETNQEPPPFLDQNKTQPRDEIHPEGNPSTENVIGLPSEKLKKVPPEPEIQLSIEWHQWHLKFDPNTDLNEKDILAQIDRFQACGGALAKLRMVFEYLKSSPERSKIAPKFKLPKHASIQHFNEGSYLEVAYMELMASPEKQAQLKRQPEGKPKLNPFVQKILDEQMKSSKHKGQYHHT